MKQYLLVYVILLSLSAMTLLGCHFAGLLTIGSEYLDKLLGLVMLPYTVALGTSDTTGSTTPAEQTNVE